MSIRVPGDPKCGSSPVPCYLFAVPREAFSGAGGLVLIWCTGVRFLVAGSFATSLIFLPGCQHRGAGRYNENVMPFSRQCSFYTIQLVTYF